MTAEESVVSGQSDKYICSISVTHLSRHMLSGLPCRPCSSCQFANDRGGQHNEYWACPGPAWICVLEKPSHNLSQSNRISILQLLLTARFNLIHCEPLIGDRVLRLAQVLSHQPSAIT